jgi:hypothetical protein
MSGASQFDPAHPYGYGPEWKKYAMELDKEQIVDELIRRGRRLNQIIQEVPELKIPEDRLAPYSKKDFEDMRRKIVLNSFIKILQR